MFRDDYTDFFFNGIHSSNFKVWITNKNDLQRSMSPNFSDKFNSSTYGQIRYHEGTTIDKQDFKLSCAAINVTRNEWEAISEWLSPLKSGKLSFDWNDKYYYMVKISKAPSGVMFTKGKIDDIMGDLYIITFTLEMTTVGDWAALGPYCWQEQTYSSTYSASSTSSTSTVTTTVNPSVFANAYYIPQIVYRTGTGTGTNTEEYYKITKDVGSTGVIFKYNGIDFPFCKITYNTDKFTLTYSYDASVTETETIADNEVYFPTLGWQLQGTSTAVSRVNLYPWTFANCGVFNMYPQVTNSVDTTIKSSLDEELYKFKFTSGVSGLDTTINMRNGTITQNNTPIHSAKANSGVFLYKDANSDYTNTGVYGISSGRPELLKTIIEDINASGVMTLKLNAKPIYSRENHFFMNLFRYDFIEEVNKYGVNGYSSGIYSVAPINYALVDTPIIEVFKDSDGWWKMKITIKDILPVSDYYDYSCDVSTPKTLTSFLTSIKNQKNFLYVSMCDYESFCIDYTKEEATADNPSISSTLTIGCQIRSVI